MSMYKRPSQRVRVSPMGEHKPAPVGSFLYNVINPPPIDYPIKIQRPVYQQDTYLKLLKKNNEQLGIPYVDPELPISDPYIAPVPIKEPDLPYCDHIRVSLRVLKSGIVRVKIHPSIAVLNELYWRKSKVPPLRQIIQAFKSYGFSDTYIERIKASQVKADLFREKVGKIIEKIFDKEPVKKVKKKKKSDDDVHEDVDDAPPVPTGDEEEEALDVEPDEDEEVVEEEYFSEPET